MKQETNNFKRIGVWLIALFLALGFSTAATVAPVSAAVGVAVDRPEEKQQKGYQLTPHVIEYYKSLAN